MTTPAPFPAAASELEQAASRNGYPADPLEKVSSVSTYETDSAG